MYEKFQNYLLIAPKHSNYVPLISQIIQTNILFEKSKKTARNSLKIQKLGNPLNRMGYSLD